MTRRRTESDTALKRKWRAERKASGLCLRCKKPNDTSYCDTCKTKYREYARIKRAKRKVNGICIVCPSPVWRGGSAYCNTHRKKAADRAWKYNGAFGTRHAEFHKVKNKAIWTELKSQLNGHFAEVKPWIEEHFDLFKEPVDHLLFTALPIETWLAKEDTDEGEYESTGY